MKYLRNTGKNIEKKSEKEIEKLLEREQVRNHQVIGEIKKESVKLSFFVQNTF